MLIFWLLGRSELSVVGHLVLLNELAFGHSDLLNELVGFHILITCSH